MQEVSGSIPLFSTKKALHEVRAVLFFCPGAFLRLPEQAAVKFRSFFVTKLRFFSQFFQKLMVS